MYNLIYKLCELDYVQLVGVKEGKVQGLTLQTKGRLEELNCSVGWVVCG
jgi:hypothetical protein